MKILLNGFWDARIDPEENGFAQMWFKEPIKSEYKVKVPGCIQQLDELVEEFNEEICDYFEEDAADHARKNWDESYFEPDWDMMPGGHDDYRIDESKKETVVDDSFDMSLRTLL